MLFDQVILHSPLSPKECRDILVERLDSPMSFFGNNEFIGSVTETSLKLRKRSKGRRKSFQTLYAASMEMLPAGGCQISGRVRISLGDIIFCAVSMLYLGWSVLTVSVPTAFTYCFGDASSLPPHFAGDIRGPLFMIVFLLGLFALCRYSARHEEAQIMAFLSEAIQAQAEKESW